MTTPFKNVELRFFNLNDLILMKLDRGLGEDFNDAEKLISSMKDRDDKDLAERFVFMLKTHHGSKEGKQMFKLNVSSFFFRHEITYPTDADTL